VKRDRAGLFELDRDFITFTAQINCRPKGVFWNRLRTLAHVIVL